MVDTKLSGLHRLLKKLRMPIFEFRASLGPERIHLSLESFVHGAIIENMCCQIDS